MRPFVRAREWVKLVIARSVPCWDFGEVHFKPIGVAETDSRPATTTRWGNGPTGGAQGGRARRRRRSVPHYRSRTPSLTCSDGLTVSPTSPLTVVVRISHCSARDLTSNRVSPSKSSYVALSLFLLFFEAETDKWVYYWNNFETTASCRTVRHKFACCLATLCLNKIYLFKKILAF